QVMATIPTAQGLGYVIPAWTLERLIPRLKKGDFVVAAPEMVLAMPTPKDIYDAGWNGWDGVVVSEVKDNTAVAKAGVRNGDILIAVDGQHVGSTAEANTLIALVERGQRYRLKVLRNQQQLDFTITK